MIGVAAATRVATLGLGVTFVTAACAAPAVLPAPGGAGAARAFAFERDTFAFPNEVRAHEPETAELYANYCFVLARAIRQFWSSARFDPVAPRLDAAGYVGRVREVAARPAWQAPLPEADRVVIPGYGSLREFSRAEAAAVKTGLGGRFWTLVHWTNWRVTMPVTRAHQERVAAEIAAELAAGRLVQLLVTNWPIPELNHTVVAFAYRDGAPGVLFSVWDPNDPHAPSTITFDREHRRFEATALPYTRPGPIRVFRMTYSWWL
jgi:hypothetical protein